MINLMNCTIRTPYDLHEIECTPKSTIALHNSES